MMMRFAGGYKFYANSTATKGMYIAPGGNVGIGESAPLARLHVADSNVVFSAEGTVPFSAGIAPVSGAGRRMMWYADKAAFRAGYVDGTQWDTDSVGMYSMALGFNPKATGQMSTAIGFHAIAAGGESVAIGGTASSGGEDAVAMGYLSSAAGDFSVAIGVGSNADGESAIAIGGATASGDLSIAMGTRVSTNGKSGAFAIGDNTPGSSTSNDVNNQMVMRFAGGYKLYTNGASTVGAQLAAGGNSWATISDVRKKENFASVDGEDFLKKIAKFKLTSWNYKGQDAKAFRHYGPMAQDFYAAFGNDSYGTIGNDTTINQADMEGVSFVAIQALERRTQEQANEIAALRKENAMLRSQSQQVAELNVRLQAVEASLNNKEVSKK